MGLRCLLKATCLLVFEKEKSCLYILKDIRIVASLPAQSNLPLYCREGGVLFCTNFKWRFQCFIKRTHTHTHTHTHTAMRTWTRTSTHMQLYTLTHTRTYTYIHTHLTHTHKHTHRKPKVYQSHPSEVTQEHRAPRSIRRCVLCVCFCA
jgi:hypothetical protein